MSFNKTDHYPITTEKCGCCGRDEYCNHTDSDFDTLVCDNCINTEYRYCEDCNRHVHNDIDCSMNHIHMRRIVVDTRDLEDYKDVDGVNILQYLQDTVDELISGYDTISSECVGRYHEDMIHTIIAY